VAAQSQAAAQNPHGHEWVLKKEVIQERLLLTKQASKLDIDFSLVKIYI